MSSVDQAMQKLGAMGWLTEDVEYKFVGTRTERIPEREYFVQVNGELTTKGKWFPKTTKSPSKYLREDLKDYPDAMILRTKYV